MTDENKMNDVFKKVCIRSDSWRDTCQDLLSKIEQRNKKLKGLRRIKKKESTTYKGAYMVANEKQYQIKIDEIYGILKLGSDGYTEYKREFDKDN